MKFIIGKKIEMTERFAEDGSAVPVTVVEAGPCAITQVKSDKKDGYVAVQVGFGDKKKINKSIKGHLKGLSNYRHFREFFIDEKDGYKRGELITVSVFQPGDKVKVIGTSKGKGFQGVVRRHGFKGSPASHGHKDQLRMPGSIGATDAARVFKGTRMAGHMGSDRVTVANLTVIEIVPENNLILLKGAVPGARNSLISIFAQGEMKLEKEKAVKPKDSTPEKPVADNSPVPEKVDNKELVEKPAQGGSASGGKVTAEKESSSNKPEQEKSSAK